VHSGWIITNRVLSSSISNGANYTCCRIYGAELRHCLHSKPISSPTHLSIPQTDRTWAFHLTYALNFQPGSITITVQISMHLSVSERERRARNQLADRVTATAERLRYTHIIQQSKFEFQIVAGSSGMSVWCGQPQMALASATAVLIRGIWPVRLPAN
jgi:hypothetical protein